MRLKTQGKMPKCAILTKCELRNTFHKRSYMVSTATYSNNIYQVTLTHSPQNTMNVHDRVKFWEILNNVICNMDGPRDCHTEWSKSDREGEISYDIPQMWNLKRNHSNELIYKTNRSMDLENKVNGCQRRDSCRVWYGYVHCAIIKADNQQGSLLYSTA